MTKLDLVRELSDRLSVTQKECFLFLNCLNEVAIEVLQQNEVLKLPGLGRLSPRFQASRPGRNLSTGAEFPIPERMSVRFKASKNLIQALNENTEEGKI